MMLDFSKINILVAGDVILDNYILGNVSRISPEAPVPVVKHTESKTTLGGATNVANNLIKLGCKVTILGLIGNDVNGATMRSQLKKNRIQNELIEIHSFPTISKTRIVSNGHQICRVDHEEPFNDNVELLDLLVNKNINYSKFDILILSDYNKGFIDSEVSQFLIKVFSESNKKVIVDPKKKDWRLYRYASCITPNFKEFSELVDNPKDELDTIIHEARIIIKKFKLESLLITRSEKGMVWVDHTDFINIKAKAKEVFDVSGAGDTVIATLAASYAKGLDINKSLHLANIAAGIVVGKVGTVPIEIDELQTAFDDAESNFVEISSLIKRRRKNVNIVVSKIEENSFDFIKTIKSNIGNDNGEVIIAVHSDEYFEKKFNKKPKFCASDKLKLYSHLDFINGVTVISSKDQESSLKLINF
jgi:rfaE bifunctional protein kinase chain/domain